MSCARVHYLKGFDAVGVVVVGLLSNVIILWGPSRAPVYVAGLVLTCLLPGYLLTRTMLSADEGIDQVERVVLAGGMGFAVLVVITLGLHFIPGPLNVKLVLVAFDGLLLLLGAVLAGQRRLASPSDVGRTATVAPASRYGLFILLVLVLSAAFFRLANLGYSEFQGDEARAMLMAAGVIRGEEQILFLHRKGPVEILMPAAFYALGGTTDELVARLPFAVASLGGILCVYCLVKRLFPHREIAAPMAAGLLAVDGYLIAFGRIVQYQSVVFLMMALAVWCAYVWYSSGKSVLLWLTAAFLAVGTLAHYETVVVAPVLIWLFCSRACREGWPLRRWIRRALGPGLLAVVVVGAFYVPFVCHPRFIPTAQYLTGERLGTAGLYNNLGDFFWRATFYNSTYYIAFLCVGLVALVIRELSSSLPPVLAVLIMVTTLVGLALSAVSPSALTAGNLDLAILPAALSMAVLIGAPRVAREEKVAFLWFAVPSLIALFLTRKPKNHVYLMFPAWAVLVGVATDRFVVAVRGRAARLRWARYLWHPGVAFGCGMLLMVFGYHSYVLFVRHTPNYLRGYPTTRPAFYVSNHGARLPRVGFFGFPHRNGWKGIGALYAQGVLKGTYGSDEEPLITSWYARKAARCPTAADHYFVTDPVQDALPLEVDFTLDTPHLEGFIWSDGRPALEMYSRKPVDGPTDYDLSALAPAFDATTQPDVGLWALTEPLSRCRVDAELGEQARLIGFDAPRQVAAGEALSILLYWRPRAASDRPYSVFVHVEMDGERLIAQSDGPPACGSEPTTKWQPGATVVDGHSLTLEPNTTPGEYQLLVGLYDSMTGERLPVSGRDADPGGNAVYLGQVVVTAPSQP